MKDFEGEKRASPEARAERIRYVRESLLKLTREEFSFKTDISASSLQNWEQVRNKQGITEGSARRLAQAFQKEGVECSVEWLLYAIGEKPKTSFSKKNSSESVQSPEEEIILAELKNYHELNPNSIDTRVSDDGMLPSYWAGDYVAGKSYRGNDIKKTIGLACIIELETHERVVRMLELGEQENLFNLYCTNPNTSKNKIVRNVSVNSSAPILWVRRQIVINK